MRIIPSVATVIGEPQPKSWAQTLSVSAGYAVIEIHDDETAARNLGIKILSELTLALNTRPVSLDAVRKIADYAFKSGVKSVIVLVPVGNVLYIASSGDGKVYLKRDNQLAVLIEEGGGISGEIKVKDTLLLATGGFLDVMPQIDLVNTFDHLPPVVVAEKLTLQIHQSGKINNGAALIYQISGFTQEDQLSDPQAWPKSSRSWSFPVFPNRRQIIKGFAQIRERNFFSPNNLINKVVKIKSSKRMSAFFVAGIMVFIFIISVYLGIVGQQTKKTATAAELALSQAQHAFDEGMALRDLNPLKGRERLNDAKKILDPIVNQNKGPAEKNIKELYRRISDNLILSMQITDVTPTLYFDAGLLKSGASVGQIVLTDDTLGLLDLTNRSVFSLKIPSKSGTIIGGGDIVQTGSLLFVSPPVFYVYSKDAIYELSGDGKGQKKLVIKNDGNWGKIVSLTGYGGNIYLLDAEKGRIWKYVGVDRGFSDRREYLSSETTVDLSSAANIIVDGSVWVSTKSGKIIKFTQGNLQPFVPQGIEPVLGNDLQIYTSDLIEHLYILDVSNKRIVVLGKDGVYVAQYVWKTQIPVTGFTVSENQKKIFLLSAGQISAFDIK
jgi:hypothetical protein